MYDEIVGEYIRDTTSKDVGKIVEAQFKGTKYYLVKWIYVNKDSWHYDKRRNDEQRFAMYTKDTLVSSRFKFLTEQEAFFWVL